MLKTTRSAETMLADRYCDFSSAEFFQLALSASAYHASKCAFTVFCSLRATRFSTKRYRVPRAITLTASSYIAPTMGAMEKSSQGATFLTILGPPVRFDSTSTAVNFFLLADAAAVPTFQSVKDD